MERNKLALFHSGTSEFCKLYRKENSSEYTLILRTGSNDTKHVYVILNGVEYEMCLFRSEETFDYYYYTIVLKNGVMIDYYFKVQLEKETVLYGIAGVFEDMNNPYKFELTSGFETPDWAKGAIMYQIFPDRFNNGDKTNDVESGEYAYVGTHVEKVDDWFEYPDKMDVNRFYGGDLQGVWDKLDYLEKLGVDVIYFNPLFVSPSNHKYDIQDYDYIDPHYGKIVKDGGNLLKAEDLDNTHASKYICRTTDKENLEASNRFFAEFVEEVHKRGMKIILDGVFNHCGSFNKWMDREGFYKTNGNYVPGAYSDKNSPYNSFFKFTKDSWPNNCNYEGWWGFDTLPKLNYEESEKLCQYIIDIGVKWVSPPYNVDGWRLDVAADLGHGSEYNHTFWKRFRKAVKAANKDAIILAEHYGAAKEWLRGDEWDTVMNYDAFMEPISWFLTGVDKHSDNKIESLMGDGNAFINAMTYHMSNFQAQSILVAMNELSNHDHSRFLSRTNGMVGRIGSLGPKAAEQDVSLAIMKEAVVMQMTLPGAPTIYYGDEAGLCGWTDPDDRRTYPWGKENLDLLEFHRDMICIHKQNKAISIGAYRPLTWGKDYVCYGRFTADNKVITMINNSDEELEIDVPAWLIELKDGDILNRVMLSQDELYNVGRVKYTVESGILKLKVPGKSASVYVK